ncbi:tumor necrosis factor a (TNF superfamily, member 2) [Aplochiton taeniatus]
MGDNCKVLVEQENGAVLATPAEVTVVRDASGRWRTIGALMAIALCFSAAIFFTWHGKKQDLGEGTDDLRHTLRQISDKTKAAIHLEGEYDRDSLPTQVHWKNDVGQSFTQGDLRLEDNEIVILRKGLYFVYSQASFKVTCPTNPGSFGVNLSHMVKIWSRSKGDDDVYRPLLHSVRTACVKATGTQGCSFNAVYMGAVFKLDRGDKLKTEIPKDRLDDLEGDDGRTFFGVFAL